MTAIELGFGNRVRNDYAELLRVSRRRASEDEPDIPVSLADCPLGRIASVVRRKGQAVASDHDRKRVKVAASVLNVRRNRGRQEVGRLTSPRRPRPSAPE